jgi:hypothetical protein
VSSESGGSLADMPVRRSIQKAKMVRAGDGIRTHDNDVGNVVLYQLSYTRKAQTRPVSTPQQPRGLRRPRVQEL